MTSIILNPNLLKRGENDWKVYFTYNDIVKLPEYPETPFIEILKGELYVVPSPAIKHQRISRNLENIFFEYLKTNPIAEIFNAPIDVVFSEDNVLIPDLVVISKNNSHIIQEKNISGVPDLIIEILSSNIEHDTVKKKEIYEINHVPEYWIIDPEKENLTINYFETSNSAKYSIKGVFKSEIVTSIIFPGIKIDLKEIFPLNYKILV